ncbi:MAG: T9SS type A sorting domain-containing protein [Bacteroidia bacterium]|nr:T9SS type A sorting domain-containing protein [Bacteroidia bacterium]
MTRTIAQNTEENSPDRGQDPCERTAQIETNPFNPKNTEWYTQRNRFNWMDYVTLLNGGKMRIPYFDNNNRYGNGLNSIFYFNNPFFDEDEDYLKHINLFSNTTNLQNQLVVDNDYSNFHRLVDEMDITSVEHGWELLWKFDGYEADGVTPVSGVAGSDFKSMNFILYNRYTGMLRWFMAPKVNGNTYNELEPLIEFKDNQVASLFRNYNGLDQALDKTTEVVRIASPAQTSFSLPYFSMADFNISYDPCVCYFDSKLSYSLNANTTANIDLYGRLEGTGKMLNESDAVNTDRLLSLYKNADNNFRDQVKYGLLEYKNYGKLVDDFNKFNQKSNIYDDVYGASKIVAEIADLGLTAVDPSRAAYKKLKIISKFTGFASMPFKTDKSTKSPPMLIEAQMTLTGQLTSTTTLNGFSFDMFTPGSFNTPNSIDQLNSENEPDRFEYPVYNQALGLYALLKTPQKQVGKLSPTEVNINAVAQTRNNTDIPITFKLVDSVQRAYTFEPQIGFKLIENLQYTFNPAAQINAEATQIEVAWGVEVNKLNNLGVIGGDMWNFTSPNMKRAYDYEFDKNTKEKRAVFFSEFMPIECITQFVPIFNYSVKPEALRILSTIFPSDQQNKDLIQQKLLGAIAFHRQRLDGSKPQITNTFLKVNITYRYNRPDGNGLNDIVHFQTFTYLVEGNNANNAILNNINTAAMNAPSELTIDGKHYTSNETIYVWDELTLKGNITADPGVIVQFKSGGTITVDPEANIDPEIVLMIEKPGYCQATRIYPTAVTREFCNSQATYKGNQLSKADGANRVNENKLIEYKAMVFPNPASQYISIQSAQKAIIEITITDINGKLVKTQTIDTKDVFQYQMEIEDLDNGMYFVTTKSEAGTSVSKIIKTGNQN